MKRNVFVLFLVIVISLFSGIFGFILEGSGPLKSLYHTLQLFVLEADVSYLDKNIFLTIAFFSCPLLTVTAVINLIWYYAKGGINILRISRLKDHIVICGLTRISFLLARDFLKEGKKIVVIDYLEQNPLVQELSKSGVFYIDGDSRNRLKLSHAHISKAKYILVYSPDDNINIEISKTIYQVINEKKDKVKVSQTHLVKVFIHIADYFNLEIFKSYIEAEIDSSNIQIDYHATNLYTKAASKVIDDLSPDKYVDIKEKDQIEVLIQPLNEMGYALLTEVAHMYHFPNLGKTKIHVVDDDINERKRYLLNKLPMIDQIVDLEFHEKSVFYCGTETQDISRITTLFLSENADSENLIYSKRLRQRFFDLTGKLDFPYLGVVLHEDSTIAELFENITTEADFLVIRMFNLYSDFSSKKIVIENKEHYDRIAMQIHNLYLDQHLDPNDLIKSWDKLTDAQKDFNRYPARHFPIKLRYLGLDPGELQPGTGFNNSDLNINDSQIEIIGRMEHNRWVAEKLLTGFVKGKHLSDQELQNKLKSKLKYHKDIRDWEELTVKDKSKDLMALDQIKFILERLNSNI